MWCDVLLRSLPSPPSFSSRDEWVLSSVPSKNCCGLKSLVQFLIFKKKSSSACIVNSFRGSHKAEVETGTEATSRPQPGSLSLFLPIPRCPSLAGGVEGVGGPLSVSPPPSKSLCPTLCVLAPFTCAHSGLTYSPARVMRQTLWLGVEVPASLLLQNLGHFSHSNPRAFSMGLSFSEFLLRCGEGGVRKLSRT